ncbi:amidase domain-containing protein [Buchananella hordeovulneris]|uniref:amidase domain-containing protein n=1 Tax=Buchananella hordeovulneris TaxID=52770 RepID=UPI00163A0677
MGDLIFYNLDGDENNTMDHVAIVTSLNDQDYPFVTQHTSAARDKYWSWSLSHSNWVASAYPGSSAYLVRFK